MASDAYEHLARVLPDYDLGRELGRGQLGVVFARPATASSAGTWRSSSSWAAASDEENAARFRREARIMAQLDHPHVVTVYDYREDGDARAPGHGAAHRRLVRGHVPQGDQRRDARWPARWRPRPASTTCTSGACCTAT